MNLFFFFFLIGILGKAVMVSPATDFIDLLKQLVDISTCAQEI